MSLFYDKMLTTRVSIKHFHVVFSSFMLLLSLRFFYLFFMLSYLGLEIQVVWDVYSSVFYNYSIVFSITSFSTLFSCLVSFITSVVFIYSHYYIGFYTNFKFFIFTTFGFVLSMLFVINCVDLFIVMLGWDGLGVISYFLIVYYNSSNSIYSGLFTMLINRVGDALLVLRVAFISLGCSVNTLIRGVYGFNYILVLVLIVGLMTKSAIFPFSPWLPAAMSAPTPISSLVHSSTLVTAGLYIMTRFSRVLYSFPDFMLFLVIASVFTTFYAGLNSLVETDLKKLVALSTLSHLGFIGLAIGMGFDYLAIFHLFTHALFKSLIFMSLGEIIRSQSHYQDIRYLSTGISLTPVSSSYIFISSLRLFGLPFVSGFYSKDFILESSQYSYWCSGFLISMVYLNLVFTYVYTTRIMRFCVSSVKNSPYFVFPSSLYSHFNHILILSIVRVLFGYLYTEVLFSGSVLPVVPFLRSLPVTLLCSVLTIFVVSSKSITPPPLVISCLGSIMFLASFNSNFLSKQSYSFFLNLAKTVEHGILHSVTLQFPYVTLVSFSRLFWYVSKSPVYLILLLSITLFVLLGL